MFKFIRNYLRRKHIARLTKHQAQDQRRILHNILRMIPQTQYGKSLGVNTYSQKHIQQNRKSNIPIVDYEQYKPRIEQSKVHKNSIRPGQIPCFSASSGTTSAKKHIPVTKQALRDTAKAGRSLSIMMRSSFPNHKIFRSYRRPLAGSIQHTQENGVCIGDVSALMIRAIPKVLRSRYLFPLQDLLISDRQTKRDIFLQKLHKSVHKPIVLFGVTSRIHEMLRYIQSDNKHLFDTLTKHIQAIVRGGVSVKPFVQQLQQRGLHNLIGVYNASEGYIGFQDISYHPDKPRESPYILLCNHGIYYECIPFTAQNFDSDGRLLTGAQALSLDEITQQHIDQQTKFALVITTNAGLYRYLLGDVIRFVDKQYRFVIEGRTKQSLNLKGEELMVDHTDTAVAKINEHLPHIGITHYTVGPDSNQNPTKHIRVIETIQPPTTSEQREIQQHIDQLLQEYNADYKAKRNHNILLQECEIHFVPNGTFSHRLQQHNKLGGQNKVPKLTSSTDLRQELVKNTHL